MPKWGSTPVDRIRNSNLAQWYDTFLETTPQYGALATKKVIQLIKLGHEQELVESVPMFKIRYVATKRRKPLDRQGVCKLVEALDDILRENRLHSNANAIISIMNTGERARAGLQLHTREVDYDKKCITKSRKFDQVKTLPISDYAVQFLQSIHPRGGGYYFPNKRDPSKPIKYAALLAFLKKLCVTHEILSVDGTVPTIHCMRHTYATLLEDKGLPVSHIQRLLGHTSIKSTLRYIHGNGAAAREGANLLEVTRVPSGR
ncbi:MAG: tyrosine-type recombinase/integrase [Nannocystaceae bacterium]